eukprot:CAMPEP_0114487200 /NCGR_PEP_ID=MMETSP0109-20121206/636_1 /TAXON_ID=29199 /ORGANISM="Chlorarachnion reptans, Strain CCCM449" /LENGTH=369 /DNA_ID=CAMNT_0001663443 /DNA_START=45 /DNA_END=1154 /DNA_ORIENTATION=-
MASALRNVRNFALEGSEGIESDFDELVNSFSEKQDLKYVIGVDTLPEVTWKEPYVGMEVSVSSLNKPGLNEKLVEKAVMNVRKRTGELIDESDREVRKGDLVMMSYMGINKATQEALIELGGQRPKQFDTEDDTIVPGFMDNMIGAKVDEIREFEVVFPDNFLPTRHRGVTATFKAMVHKIYRPILPPEDSKLAAELVPDAKTMEEAREFLRVAVEKEAEVKDLELVDETIIEKIGALAQCSIPDILIQENGQQMYGAQLMEFQNSGRVSPGVLNSMMTPQMVSKFIRDNRDEIETRVRATLAFDQIQKENNLQITEAMINERVEEMVEGFKEMGIDYDIERVREQAEELVTSKVILDFVRGNAVIKYT